MMHEEDYNPALDNDEDVVDATYEADDEADEDFDFDDEELAAEDEQALEELMMGVDEDDDEDEDK